MTNTTGWLALGMGPRTSGTGRRGKPGGNTAPAMAPKGGNIPEKQ